MDTLTIDTPEGEFIVPGDKVDTLPPVEAAAITATIRQAIREGYDIKIADVRNGGVRIRWTR